MLLQKQTSRKSKNKTYTKWAINIPNQFIFKLGWKAGENIKGEIKHNKLLLSKQTKITVINKIAKYTRKLTPHERFMRVFTNLPIEERSMVIIVIDGNPITWKLALDHIKHETEFGNRILKKMLALQLI